MLTRDEAIVEARKAGIEHAKRAAALKAEGLSISAIARVMGIFDTPGVTAKQKVRNLLNSKQE